jgi:2-polyprenyl-3-methyl-5-hydroxy-6-metoxy-1,4-benzoquinol methylase
MADLKEEEILGPAIARHWYYVSKSSALVRLIGGSRNALLDVGAGSGFFAKTLIVHGVVSQATCVDPGYLESVRTETVHGRPVNFVRQVGNLDVGLVLMMDVLEHVDDDSALISEYMAKVPSGTMFVFSVPAFMALWSQHDVFLEHKRRYTLRQLERVVASSGLRVTKGCYYFATILPLAAIVRRLTNRQGPSSSLKIHSTFTNFLLRALCGLELGFYRFNRWGGLTVFCVAIKP